jgi:SAM-dependent methyltransferase
MTEQAFVTEHTATPPVDGIAVQLGAGRFARPDWITVDIYPHPGITHVADLNERWPFEDDSVDFIDASHILEHLRSPIHSMNEAWRVLKMGGVIDIVVPSTDGRGAFQDTTHVSFWNKNSFLYYAVNTPDHRLLYPDIKCSFYIRLGDTAKSPDGNIFTRAVCMKVPLDATSDEVV